MAVSLLQSVAKYGLYVVLPSPCSYFMQPLTLRPARAGLLNSVSADCGFVMHRTCVHPGTCGCPRPAKSHADIHRERVVEHSRVPAHFKGLLRHPPSSGKSRCHPHLWQPVAALSQYNDLNGARGGDPKVGQAPFGPMPQFQWEALSTTNRARLAQAPHPSYLSLSFIQRGVSSASQ